MPLNLSLNDIITIATFCLALFSIGLQYRPKHPKICYTGRIESIPFQYNQEKKMFQAWIPLVFQNDGDGTGVILIEERWFSTKTAGFKAEPLQLFKLDQMTPLSALQINPSSFGIIYAKIETSRLQYDAEPDKDIEMKYHINFGVSFRFTESSSSNRLKRWINREMKLKIMPYEFIVTLYLTEQEYKRGKKYGVSIQQ